MLKAFVTLSGIENAHTVEDSDTESQDEEDSLESLDIPAHNEKILELLLEHVRCFLHNLQNTVKDGLEVDGPASGVIGKASSLVSHIHHPALASDILKVNADPKPRTTDGTAVL